MRRRIIKLISDMTQVVVPESVLSPAGDGNTLHVNPQWAYRLRHETPVRRSQTMFISKTMRSSLAGLAACGVLLLAGCGNDGMSAMGGMSSGANTPAACSS